MLRYLEVKEGIREMIQRQGHGSRIPSRNMLCQKFEVARNTVDKAIMELEKEGILYSVKGSGTFVAQANSPRHRNIAVVLPSIVEGIYPRFILGIEQSLSDLGHNVMLFSSEYSPDRQRFNVLRGIEVHADGFIIIPTVNSELSAETFSRLRGKKIPFVLCYRSVDGLDAPFVGVNNSFGTYQATRHLIECGCRRISYISDKMYSVALERYSGYEIAMLERAGAAEKGGIILGSYEEDQLLKRIRAMFSAPNRPDGALCFDDNTAAHLCAVLQEMGLSIGTDVKVVGNNNSDICEKLLVPLTSVSSRASTMGKEAVKLLMCALQSDEADAPMLSLLTPKLYIRESTRGGVAHKLPLSIIYNTRRTLTGEEIRGERKRVIMKLATFVFEGRETWGIVLFNEEDGQEWVYEPEKCEWAFRKVANGTNGYFMCLPEFMPNRSWPKTLIEFLQLGDEGMERLKRFETFLKRYVKQSDPYYISCCGHPLSQVRLRSPIPDSRLFLGLVQNSPSFWRANPARIHSNFLPQAHQRAATSVVGSGEVYLGAPGGNVELGLVIGKECYHVSIEKAYDCIAGYVVVYDSQVNTYYEQFDQEQGESVWREKKYPDWFAECTCSWIGKGADSHCICGPYITTKDEIGNPYDLLVWTETNHTRRDRSSTAGYSLGVERTVHFFSQFMHLHPGDILHMGTVGTDGIYVDMESMPFGADGSVGGEIECCGKIWAHVHYPEKFGDTRTEKMKEIPLVPAASDFIAAHGAQIDSFTPAMASCVWTCYANFDTCQEALGFVKTPSPRMLNGPASQIASPDSGAIQLSPIAQDLDISAEVAVIISKVGKKIPGDEAQEYILGYAPVLSVCDRSIDNQIIEPATTQERDIGKVYGRWGDGYNVLGDVKKLTDFAGKKITLSVEGIGHAEGNTSEYVCSPARCLEFLTLETTVLPGDVILLGRVGQIIHVDKEAYQGGLRVTAQVEGLGSVSAVIKPFLEP